MANRLLLDLSPLRASPAFRAVFAARTVSVFGIGFLLVAVPLQVYDLTGSTAGVAAVIAAVGVSALVGTFVGGVLADRVDRRRVILAARATAGVAFLGLTVNALLPEPGLAAVVVLGALDGLCGGISGTALMAATPTLVGRDRLAAAGALIAMTTDIGAIAAPALGGILIAAAGIPANYAVCTAAAVVTTVLLLRLPPLPPPGTGCEPGRGQVAGGFRFAARHRVVGGTIVVGFVTMALTGWAVLLPAYATEVLDVGPAGFGVLFAAPAVGALLGSLTSGWTGSVDRIGGTVLAAVAVSSAGLVVAGTWAVPVLVFAGLALHGAGRVVGDVLRYAVVLRHTPDELRGRVAAVWTAQVTLGVTVGAAVAAATATLLGPERAFVAYGLLGCAAAVALAVALPAVRRLRCA
ncbi:enterobactin transporter EntS [Pseudonocardia saturnea]